MSSPTIESVAPAPAVHDTLSAAPTATILVATDATEDSESAIRLGSLLAGATGAPIQMISVAEQIPAIADYPGLSSPVGLFEDPEVTIANRVASVTAQTERILGARVPVTVRFGAVGREIAEFAAATSATLIVTGRGRHGFSERILGEEHLAQLLRTAVCPVLAVTPALAGKPKCIVIGVDFGATDVVTARAALQIADADARIYLVHVKPDIPFAVPTGGAWSARYDDGSRAGLSRMRRELGLSPAQAECAIVAGHPGHSLIDFAVRVKSDLIAVGTHGRGFFHRLVIGSTTTYVLRTAPSSLLAVPSVSGAVVSST